MTKIVSGGQTGVDRAALDVAMTLGMACGGWCPRGRRAEDGIISLDYPLQETPSTRYPQRTHWNVRDSDGTLILTMSRSMTRPLPRGAPLPDRGTALTLEVAARLNKPHLVVDLADQSGVGVISNWLRAHGISILNVAGPRESTRPGIYTHARLFLLTLFSENPVPAP